MKIMQCKKIALVASILMVTLVVGVYAVIISNTLTAEWTVKESTEDLKLSWVSGTPTGEHKRGVWYETEIKLENTGLATYKVIDKFTISTSGAGLPTGCIKIEYYTDHWEDMTGVITGWGSATLSGYFGPSGGFDCTPGWDATTLFRYMFDGDAPLTGYTFNAWVEEM